MEDEVRRRAQRGDTRARITRWLIGLATAAGLTLRGAPARAQLFVTQGPSPGASPAWLGDGRRPGPFLRGILGGGYTWLGTRMRGEGVNLHGPAIYAEGSAGGRISRALMLHGDLFVSLIPRPRVEVPDSLMADRVLYALTSLGVGLTGFFGDSGVFMSGSIGLAAMFSNGDWYNALRGGLGVAVRVLAGRDWQVSRRVRLGVVGSLYYTRLGAGSWRSVGTDGWNGLSANLALSTSYW